VITQDHENICAHELPARRGIAETQFQAAQLRAIEAALRLTADVRRQYWRAVAAQELVRFLNEARGSAELLEDRGERAGVDSGAKRNRFKRSGFERLCQAL